MADFPLGAALTAILIAAALFLSLRLMVASPKIPQRYQALTNWQALERTGKPNDYLMMDGDAADRPAIRFDQPAAAVAQASRKVLRDMPRTRILSESEDGLRLEAMQRSRLIGFPDFISLRIEPSGEEQSSLSAYSRAHFGYSDMGVNRKRIDALVRDIEQALTGHQTG